MKRFIKVLTFIAALSSSLTAANSYDILSVEIGVAPNINVPDFDTHAIANTFALNLRVADPLSVGFETVKYNALGSTLFNFKYDLSVLGGQTAAIISLGNGNGFGNGLLTTENVGLGFEYTPFSKKREAIVTTFKIAPRYIFDTDDVGNGVLVIGLAVGLGI
ncbi:MAG: hypothetical protein LBF86_06005 [Helicobacteraceae bacterium]|jgi:hypothetical protein|nr:hypothetical protein [Helicobacteraceae bacterium]